MVPATELSVESAPVVSVCIANYNGEKFIVECIESVLKQIDAPSFEIIVHDDASTDGSLSIARSYPQVRVLSSDRNVGFCISNNRMAEAARGTYLLLLNNDATLRQDSLATLFRAAEACAHPCILSLRQYDYFTAELLDIGNSLDLFMSPVPLLDGARNAAMVIGACFWIPKNFWQELGGFPEAFHTNAEDVYLCCLARLRGYDVRVPVQSGYMHRVGATLSARNTKNVLSSTRRRRYLSEYNRTRLMCIFFPIWLLTIMLPVHFLAMIIEGLVISAYNRNMEIFADVYLRAIANSIRNASAIADERRQVMAVRRIPFHSFMNRFTCVPQKVRVLLRAGLPRVY